MIMDQLSLLSTLMFDFYVHEEVWMLMFIRVWNKYYGFRVWIASEVLMILNILRILVTTKQTVECYTSLKQNHFSVKMILIGIFMGENLEYSILAWKWW